MGFQLWFIEGYLEQKERNWMCSFPEENVRRASRGKTRHSVAWDGLCSCYVDMSGFQGTARRLLGCSGWLLGCCYAVARVLRLVARVPGMVVPLGGC